MNRRTLLQYSLVSGAALMSSPIRCAANGFGVIDKPENVKFQMDLCPGRVGIGGGQAELIELASKHGFTAVQPLTWSLEKLDAEGISELDAKVKEAGMVWSAADLPVEFRKDESQFNSELEKLAPIAKTLQSIGVSRMGTWIMPCHDELTYMENFRQHASRIGKIAKILETFGIRLGLEYVGTKSLWTSKKFPFVHTMREGRDLIAETGQSNVGFVLDSWHWAMAEEDADAIRGLKNSDIVACDLNDAPAGIELDQQQDGTRELPMATGVIDTKGFLQALIDVGYDGPIRAEPFNKPLNELDDEPAAKKTAEAMKKAFALVGA